MEFSPIFENLFYLINNMMKANLKIFFLITVFLGIYSCSLNDDNYDKEVIIDYNTYSYLDRWTESKKIIHTDTVDLHQVTLDFFYNESEVPRFGEYRYMNKGALTSIDTTGFFIQDSELLYFVSKDNLPTDGTLPDQAEVYKYRIEDKHLILIDTTSLSYSEFLYYIEDE